MTAQTIQGAQAEAAEEQHYEELKKIIAEYRGKPGALILVLHRAQTLFGYLPRRVQQQIADGLDIPLSEVAGVVTFYSFFTMVPKGRHGIKVCLGTSCYVRGGQRLLGRAAKEIGSPGRGNDRRPPVLPGGGPLHRGLRTLPGNDRGRRCLRPGEKQQARRDSGKIRLKKNMAEL